MNRPHPYETSPRGHKWAVIEGTDELDIMAYTDGVMCNGPRCVKCGYGFCHHCSKYKVSHPCPHAEDGT